MADSGLVLDTASFSRSISSYITLSQRDAANELNRRMRQVISIAIRFTKEADKGKIRSYMKGTGRDGMPGALMYRLVPGKGLTRAERAKKARGLLGRALSSVAYIKRGYAKGLGAFGGKQAKLKSGKSAEKGWGKKASYRRLVAEFANMSFGADEISGPVLQAAIDEVTDDMLDYIFDKLSKNWAR